MYIVSNVKVEINETDIKKTIANKLRIKTCDIVSFSSVR